MFVLIYAFILSLACWLELKVLPVMTALLEMTGMTGVTCSKRCQI